MYSRFNNHRNIARNLSHHHRHCRDRIQNRNHHFNSRKIVNYHLSLTWISNAFSSIRSNHPDQRYCAFSKAETSTKNIQTLSRLLRVQEINSVPILLLTADVFAHLFLKINDFETDLLRQELLLKIDNNNSIVKSASRTKIKCLLDILMMASDRKMKQSIRSTLTTQINPAPLLIPSATAIAITTTLTPTTTVSSALTLDDQRNHLLKCIDDWTSQSENYLNLKELKLKEGENFKLNLTTGISGFEATIQCQCKTKTALGKLNGKLIPSNFYRHLKSSTCKFMKRLLKEQKDKENVNNGTSDLTAPSSSGQSRQFSNSNSQLTIPVLRSNRKRSFRSTTSDIHRKRREQ